MEIGKNGKLTMDAQNIDGLPLPTSQDLEMLAELLSFVEEKGWSKSEFGCVVSLLLPHFEFGVYYEKHIQKITNDAMLYNHSKNQSFNK